MQETIGQYLGDGDRQLEKIRSAYAAGNALGILEAIHGFRTSSAIMGALWLAELCEELEGICREGRVPADPAYLTRIEEGFLEARILLEEIPKHAVG